MAERYGLSTIFSGRLHCLRQGELVASRGRSLFSSIDNGESWRFLARVPVLPRERLKAVHRLTRRLLRADIHHVVPLGQDVLVVFAFSRILRFDRRSGKWTHAAPLMGSRPLCVAEKSGVIYYGEYRSNPERSHVHILGSHDGGKTWQSVHERSDVRHIHGVFVDPYSNAIWFTTGDNDAECGIWRTTDGFRSVERVLGGNQQFRAVALVPTPDYIYFGTDTPLEPNFIYRFPRQGGTPECLAPISSSVFYGCAAGGRVFFASVCEPSAVNETGYSSLLGSDPEGTAWQETVRLQKDRWPMKLFQYGQILFPSGVNESKYLFASSMGLENDHTCWRMPLGAPS